MEGKKKKPKKVKIAEDKMEGFKALSDAGALPPAESDDGLVEREIDVLSDIPEIDTTRADPPPDKTFKRLGLFCCFLPFATLVGVLVVFSVLYLSSKSKCDTAEIFEKLGDVNVSELELGLSRVYEACV